MSNKKASVFYPTPHKNFFVSAMGSLFSAVQKKKSPRRDKSVPARGRA